MFKWSFLFYFPLIEIAINNIYVKIVFLEFLFTIIDTSHLDTTYLSDICDNNIITF